MRQLSLEDARQKLATLLQAGDSETIDTARHLASAIRACHVVLPNGKGLGA